MLHRREGEGRDGEKDEGMEGKGEKIADNRKKEKMKR